VRRRLVLAIAGVATASVVLFAIPLAIAIQRNQRDAELLRLQRDTAAATRLIDLGAGSRDPVELPPNRDRLAVYDRGGHRVAGPGPATADALVRTALGDARAASRSEDGQLTVAVPLLSGERLTGAVRAQRSDGAVAGDVRRAWLGLLAVGVAVVAAASGAAILVARRLAAPFQRLATAAHRLGQGDFSARAPRARIVELDEIAEALDVTARRLDDLVSRERAFSADASHQLRTPLAALRLELEALQLRRPGEDAEIAASIAQVDRLQATIGTLLAAARDVAVAGREADLGALADEAQRRWQALLVEEHRPLRVAVGAPTPRVSGSPEVIEQILDVLIDNARRHGSGAVTIAAAAPSPAWASVTVRDEGNGLVDRELEPLFTRRDGGRQDGHGIGLALARSLATAEGGRLTATVGPRGSAFTLTLPTPESGTMCDDADAPGPDLSESARSFRG